MSNSINTRDRMDNKLLLLSAIFSDRIHCFSNYNSSCRYRENKNEKKKYVNCQMTDLKSEYMKF